MGILDFFNNDRALKKFLLQKINYDAFQKKRGGGRLTNLFGIKYQFLNQ